MARVSNGRKVFALLFANAALIATVYDVYTDTKSSERICTSTCTCVWKIVKNTEEYGCEPPDDNICNSDNITYSCEPPDDYACMSANLTHGNHTPTPAEFCRDLTASNKSTCSKVQWQPQEESLRHPWWCGISIATIIISSVLNNTFLMYRLIWYYGTYCHILRFTRLGNTTQSSAKYAVIAVIVFLFCTQLLPLLWLTLLVYSAFLALRGIEDQEQLEFTTVTFKMVFTIIEDIPQLYLQILFLNRALKGQEEGMTGALGFTAIMGIVLSCTNAAWNSRFKIKSKGRRIAPALITGFTLFTRIGVLTHWIAFRSLYFLVPMLCIYELIHCKTRNADLVLDDISISQLSRGNSSIRENNQKMPNNNIRYKVKDDNVSISSEQHTRNISQIEDSPEVPASDGQITRNTDQTEDNKGVSHSDMQITNNLNQNESAQDVPNHNYIDVKTRLIDYLWRCLEGLLFDGMSLKGLLVSLVYLFAFSRFEYVDNEDTTYKIYVSLCSVSSLFNLLCVLAKFIKRKYDLKYICLDL